MTVHTHPGQAQRQREVRAQGTSSSRVSSPSNCPQAKGKGASWNPWYFLRRGTRGALQLLGTASSPSG